MAAALPRKRPNHPAPQTHPLATCEQEPQTPMRDFEVLVGQSQQAGHASSPLVLFGETADHVALPMKRMPKLCLKDHGHSMCLGQMQQQSCLPRSPRVVRAKDPHAQNSKARSPNVEKGCLEVHHAAQAHPKEHQTMSGALYAMCQRPRKCWPSVAFPCLKLLHHKRWPAQLQIHWVCCQQLSSAGDWQWPKRNWKAPVSQQPATAFSWPHPGAVAIVMVSLQQAVHACKAANA
mmetsp:Transcript_77140/g.148952  ORF Transcript_77140/g.148952 Transcript_77140/m.148952 type:complete len:234 (-) Transcript_77140:502-1203(-)